ncbi:type II toxin-antitoxin system RelE/ParE family toxin [Candidatus Nomurabacteria bacterium]|nr:type II toxin-antitoxin system RelE/ParE family toxin [Candidatus Nomurabacteria bacterium]
MKINLIHGDIRDFIKNLDEHSQAEVLRVLDLLEDKGHEIRMPYSKKITKSIYELRIKTVQNVRIFYVFYQNQIFLLHAIIKQKQKLSKKDIAVAINREKSLHLI